LNPANIWTAEAVGVLREMVEDGYSFKDIAAVLGPGFTKNSCVGKARRLGIVWNSRGPAVIASRPPKPVAVVVTPADEPGEQPQVEFALATILTVTDAMCKWVIGEVTAETPVCGRPKMGRFGSRYCEEHFDRSLNAR
jgi:hypothetical protein